MKKQKLSRVGALLLALVVAVTMTATAFAAEGDEDTEVPEESPVPEQTPSVSISPVPGNSILLADQIVLTATVNNVPKSEMKNVAFVWTCSNETKLAFVDPNEKVKNKVTVRGAEVGTAQISVRITVDGKNYYDYLTLAIEYAPALDMEMTASGIYFNGTNYTLSKEPGNTWSITANVVPGNASPNATWTTSNESVVMLTENTALGGSMNFRAVNPGIAVITATVGSVTKSCVVTVSGLAIKEPGTEENDNSPVVSEFSIPVGETHSLAYKAYGQNLSDSNLAVEWSSSNPNVAKVETDDKGKSVTVTAVSEGTAGISIRSTTYTSTCYVTVVPNLAEDITTSVPDMIVNFSDPTTLRLGSAVKTNTSIIDAIKQNCTKVTQSSLNYVSSISVSTSQGTLYYGYKSEGDTGSGVGGTERYYVSPISGQRAISGISFVPKADYSGTATVTYTGYASNGKTFTGKILLDVSVVEDVGYTTIVNNPVQFKDADFSNVCTQKYGRGLSSISFTQPTKGEGVLYYNYAGSSQTKAVSPSELYYTERAPYINSLSFVPSAGFTGTVKIPYNADSVGTKYSGTVTIVVTPAAGETYINYSAVSGETVEFKLDDFTNACTSALGAASSLNYVVFTLPSSSEGVLSYSYKSGNRTYAGNLVSGDRFYRSGSTSAKPLSSVRFTPASGASGAILINFDGYDNDGKHFKGIVRVHVGNDGDGGTINYSSPNGTPVKFDVESFNELCQRSIKEALNYVTFTLPSSQRGTLFYNYNNSYSSGTAVTEGTRYYHAGTPLISNISFVPNLSFSGTASIGFTAYGVNGGHFIGAVDIDVSAPSDRTVSYNVIQGHAVKFDADDFNRMCRAATGRDISYVRFSVPSSMRGTLCYNYNEERDTYSSKVSSGSSYYRTSGQLIDNVYYLSESNHTGTIQLSFDGWNTGGTAFSGLVEINVMTPVAKTITYAGNSLAFDMYPLDFTKACMDLTGKGLDYIEFNSLPSASAGTLYTGFSGPRDHGEAAKTGTKYYVSGTPSIEGLAFLPKAGYDDIVSLTYTGVDVSGTSYTGTVQMAVNSYSSSGYLDMGRHGWAESAVNFLTTYGVVNGTGDNNYSPDQSIRRADYMVMVCRAFRLNTGNRTGFNDVSPDSYYAWAVSTAKDLGIAYGDGSNFYPESSLTREEAMVFLQRTLNVIGESIGSGSESYLNRFSDADSVSAYARGAVAAMVQRGLISGDGNGQINPKKPMSRAEMAVFLHNVLTM